jgi:UPF0755 protein
MVLRIIKISLVVSAVSILLFSAWFSLELYLPSRTAPEKIFFEIENGKGARTIAHNLKEKGIIKKEWPFLLGYKVFSSSKSLKAGEYAFSVPLSTKEVLKTIIEGGIYLHLVIIPEGMTRREIAHDLESELDVNAEDFLEACSRTDSISSLDKKATNLEGYLFPETYHFPKRIPADKIVSTFVSQFMSVFSEEWQKRATELRMSIREVVTLASLIEKEASIPEEKKFVSAVFHNRLKIGMKLDCDPTIIYDLKEKGIFKDRLHAKDLKLNTPFNTYLHRGLPPGPICNPGRESLKAALYPAEEKYLYFVSKNDGSHHFSRSFKEHQNAVIKYHKKR